MNDNFDISELLNQFKNNHESDNNTNSLNDISNDSPNTTINKSEDILNLLLAIKPFLSCDKKEKLESYINIMGFKNIINLFGGD